MKLIPGAINVNTAPLKRTSIALSLQREHRIQIMHHLTIPQTREHGRVLSITCHLTFNYVYFINKKIKSVNHFCRDQIPLPYAHSFSKLTHSGVFLIYNIFIRFLWRKQLHFLPPFPASHLKNVCLRGLMVRVTAVGSFPLCLLQLTSFSAH